MPEVSELILLHDAFEVGYGREGVAAEAERIALGEIAKAGGKVVYDHLAPQLAAVEEQEQANWGYIREMRATNERLREALRTIADGSETDAAIADRPGDMSPAAWLARQALADKPAYLERSDGVRTGEPAPAQPWQRIEARHKNGACIVVIHQDYPDRQAVARWVQSGDATPHWEIQLLGQDPLTYPDDAFTHAIVSGPPPSDIETITEAAVLHHGQPWSVPRPGRHGDVIRRLDETHPADGPFVEEQGFMTSHGRFVGRREAGRIALAAGQTHALRWGVDLYSEDLW